MSRPVRGAASGQAGLLPRLLERLRLLFAPRRLLLPLPCPTPHEEEDDMAPKVSPRVKSMVEAGRNFLLANPGQLPSSRDTAYRMKLVIADFTAAEHAQAMDALAIEFAKRIKTAAKA